MFPEYFIMKNMVDVLFSPWALITMNLCMTIESVKLYQTPKVVNIMQVTTASL